MIFSSKSIKPQLAELLNQYPDLSVTSETVNLITLSGKIHVFRSYNGYTLNNDYWIEIGIPLNTETLPYVTDIRNQIDNTYQHFYTETKQLCLATEAQIRLNFIDGFSLVRWMQDFVELYFFSYEYYQRYGEFPFGERSHGTLGILETYQDLFATCDIAKAYLILQFITSSSYRGHLRCPCGSNKKMRNCHGEKMLFAYQNKTVMDIIQKDFIQIDAFVRKEIDEYQKKTK